NPPTGVHLALALDRADEPPGALSRLPAARRPSVHRRAKEKKGAGVAGFGHPAARRPEGAGAGGPPARPPQAAGNPPPPPPPRRRSEESAEGAPAPERERRQGSPDAIGLE